MIMRQFCKSLILVASVLLSCASAAETKPLASLRVITDDNYPPYLFRKDDGSVDGYLVDYWKLWEAKTGVAVTLIATDWESAQKKVLAGLGLNRIGNKATLVDTPETRGMIAKVAHMVRVVGE